MPNGIVLKCPYSDTAQPQGRSRKMGMIASDRRIPQGTQAFSPISIPAGCPRKVRTRNQCHRRLHNKLLPKCRVRQQTERLFVLDNGNLARLKIAR